MTVRSEARDKMQEKKASDSTAAASKMVASNVEVTSK
jgi:hypothetical protein